MQFSDKLISNNRLINYCNRSSDDGQAVPGKVEKQTRHGTGLLNMHVATGIGIDVPVVGDL